MSALGLPDPSPVRPEVSEHLPAVVPTRSPRPPAAATDTDLIDAILAALNARTARTYLSDYKDFARFLGLSGPLAALEALLSSAPGLLTAACWPTACTWPTGACRRGPSPGGGARSQG